MYRYFLLLALGLITTVAQAVRLDTGTNAQVLIYPLYSTERGNETELTVRNLSAAGKALRLVIRDRLDGRPTLTLNIYLKAGDGWSGRLIAAPHLSATLVSSDESCTFPALAGGLSLTDDHLSQVTQVERLPRSRLNSGYMEIYESGELDSDLAGDCDAITQRWNNGVWSGSVADDKNADVTRPGGHLTGTAFVKNIATGSTFVLDPTPLADFRDAPVHTHPELLSRPSLADVSPAIAEVRQIIQLATRRVVVEDTVTFAANPIEAVDATLMTGALGAEIHSAAPTRTNASLLVLLPTRPYHFDSAFYGNTANAELFVDNSELVGVVQENDGDERTLAQPLSAVACDQFSAVANTVGLPNFFNFDHICELGAAELFIPNNSTRSRLTLTFSGQVVADEGDVVSGLPAIGHVVQTTRGSSPLGSAGNFARPMQRQ